VAASATAILDDIELSSLPRPPGLEQLNSNTKPAKRGLAARFAHAFLAARVNRQVSARAREVTQRVQQKKMLQTK
jgi:hypothetical protein